MKHQEHRLLKNPEAPHRYEALDLMRGVAALIVCFYHMSGLFTPHGKLFANGYLCVDLFFLLSGFVIAANYDAKIARGLGFKSFFGQRMARLYPLFVLAMALGFVVTVAQQIKHSGAVNWKDATMCFGVNLLMLPAFFRSSETVFPFNGPSWSIFFEMWVNVVFLVAWKWLKGGVLWGLIAAGALGLLAAGWFCGSIEVGWKAVNFWWGFPRVVFPFFLGVALFRSGLAERFHVGKGSVWISVVLLLLVTNAKTFIPDGKWLWILELSLVMVVFPAMVAAMSCARLSGRETRAAGFLGGASYALYLLQQPAVLVFAGIVSLGMKRNIVDLAPWTGILFVPTLLAGCYGVWRFYEVPAKLWLRNRWNR